MMREVLLRLRRIAWVAAWRVIEMLEPADLPVHCTQTGKVSFGLMSELPGCNVSER